MRRLLRLNPNSEIIFQNAVKNNSNPTRPKSSTRSEQESQSDSSIENKSETETSEIKPRAHRQMPKFHENFRREEDNSPIY